MSEGLNDVKVVDGAEWIDKDFGVIFNSIYEAVKNYACAALPEDKNAGKQDQLRRQRNDKLAAISGVMLATYSTVKDIVGK